MLCSKTVFSSQLLFELAFNSLTLFYLTLTQDQYLLEICLLFHETTQI